MQLKFIIVNLIAILTSGSPISLAQTSLRTFEIQGADTISPFVTKKVTTEGVITADFSDKNKLKGFFIQDTIGDGNEGTSDGLFVFIENQRVDLEIGDYISVSGTVKEYFKLTEIAEVTSIQKLSKSRFSVKPVDVSLPLSKLSWEKYEGMLVHFQQELTVTDNYYLGQYGELALSSNGRLYIPTQAIDPNDQFPASNTFEGNSNIVAVLKEQVYNDSNYIILNDGSTEANPPIVPFLSKGNSLRAGSTIKNLVGVVNFANNEFKIEPTSSVDIAYAERPPVPSVASSLVKVASMNVLNYFNGDGSGGGFPTPRGALTKIEFDRQQAKIVSAIKAIDADIIGLMEIENDGDGPQSAIRNLVDAINKAYGVVTYTHIPDPKGTFGNAGTDAIKVALIYKPNSVSAIGLSSSDTSKVHNRPPLSQTFRDKQNRSFSVIVNHFKSKGCSGAKGLDVDQRDGQSCFNAQRKAQSSALIDFVEQIQNSSEDSDVLLIGDFNSYEQEDPLDLLRAEGLVSITEKSYSYLFSKQSGSLDHAFVTSSLLPQVKESAKWHINADEPRVLDYGLKYNPAYLYDSGPHRFSDHDPIIIGLLLDEDFLSNVRGTESLKIKVGPTGKVFGYTTSRVGLLTLMIYDTNGREVGVISQEVNLGEGEISLNTKFPIQPGLYFYKATLTDSSDSLTTAGKITVIY